MPFLVVPLAISAACSASRATVAPTPSPSQTPNDITIAIAGDVHFSERTLSLLDNPTTAFGRIAPVLARADLAIVNLETAVTERGTPEPKEFHFRAPAAAFAAVKAAGIDAVSIANNHTLDYGQVGLADTLAAAREAGVPALGAGVAGEAYRPWIYNVDTTRVAVVALSNVDELWQSWKATDSRPGLAMLRDTDRALAAVRAAKAQSDVVVVVVHWGPEYQECPNDELRRLSNALVEAGADVVAGGHQHLLLGAGWQGKSYIAYGLGNFLWWRNDALSNDTAVLWVTIRSGKVRSAGLVPAYIDRVTGQPYPVNGEAAARILGEQKRLRICAGLTEFPVS